jgi:anti-anti-sigma factor
MEAVALDPGDDEHFRAPEVPVATVVVEQAWAGHARAAGDADWSVSTDRFAAFLKCRSAFMMVGLSGDLDGEALPALVRAFEIAVGHRPTRVVVDATGMSFCGVRGAALLVGAADDAERAGIDYALTGLSAVHRRLLDICWGDRAALLGHRSSAASTAPAATRPVGDLRPDPLPVPALPGGRRPRRLSAVSRWVRRFPGRRTGPAAGMAVEATGAVR